MSVVCLICGSELVDNSNDEYIHIYCPVCKETRGSGKKIKNE
jgi:phage FluMu protein Com